MAWDKMYPTESSMAADIKAILPSNQQMISSLQNDLLTGNLSATDRATAQAALASYTGGTTGQYSAPIPGAPDTGPATGGAGLSGGAQDLMTDATKKFLDTGKTGGPIDKTNMVDYVQKNIGNIAMILIGIIVLAIAIWATTQKQELILKTVKGGIVG